MINYNFLLRVLQRIGYLFIAFSLYFLMQFITISKIASIDLLILPKYNNIKD